MTLTEDELARLAARLDDMAPLSEDGTRRYARVAGDYLAELAADAIEALAEHATALDGLVRAVGDYKWLLNGRDDAGTCTLGCAATQGQYHATNCVAGVLGTAYGVALETGRAVR